MSAPKEHTMVLYYPAIKPGEYSAVDAKYGIPLEVYAGGESLAKIICEERGGIDIIHRKVASEWHESISIRNRITDIQVIHTYRGTKYPLYEK